MTGDDAGGRSLRRAAPLGARGDALPAPGQTHQRQAAHQRGLQRVMESHDFISFLMSRWLLGLDAVRIVQRPKTRLFTHSFSFLSLTQEHYKGCNTD